MTDCNITSLTNENKQLKDQLQNNSRGVENLLAQLDAVKSMFNESNTNCMILRTNNILLNKQVKTLTDKVEELTKLLSSPPISESKSEAA